MWNVSNNTSDLFNTNIPYLIAFNLFAKAPVQKPQLFFITEMKVTLALIMD